MRKKRWARPELNACPYCLTTDPAAHRGSFSTLFENAQPMQLELGCGKGVSTTQMALSNPNVNYIAVDISRDVLGVFRRNLEAACADAGKAVNNLLIVPYNIEQIGALFAPEDTFERIIISFPNPWSEKPRHEKRRLTHPRQLIQYRSFLRDGGEIWFKTDDAALFEDSVRYFGCCGFDIRYQTDDLTGSGFSPNYVSEHEEKFVQEGKPIHFLIAVKRPGRITITVRDKEIQQS